MGAWMYNNPLAPLGYPPYFWPQFPGLFLPYTASAAMTRPAESVSPDNNNCVRDTTILESATPENIKTGITTFMCKTIKY